MKVLAVNSSGFSASIALAENAGSDDVLWHCSELDENQKTAQHLVPAIKSLLDGQNISLNEIDLFAVTSGPGSFTGLRIGMTTLKTFAYATSSRIVGVNSLAAIAQNAIRSGAWSDGKITVAMNAFRKQLFVATFDRAHFDGQSAQSDSLTQVIPETDLADCIVQEGSRLIASGVDPASACLENISKDSVITEDLNASAIGVGMVGWRMQGDGHSADPIALLPNYFRGSAAEEKLRNNS